MQNSERAPEITLRWCPLLLSAGGTCWFLQPTDMAKLRAFAGATSIPSE